jgi:hypothetical protein
MAVRFKASRLKGAGYREGETGASSLDGGNGRGGDVALLEVLGHDRGWAGVALHCCPAGGGGRWGAASGWNQRRSVGPNWFTRLSGPNICCKIKMEKRLGSLVGCQILMGWKLKGNRKLFSNFWWLEWRDSKWIWILNESFWTFSNIEIWKLVKDLSQINLNSRFGIFLK